MLAELGIQFVEFAARRLIACVSGKAKLAPFDLQRSRSIC